MRKLLMASVAAIALQVGMGSAFAGMDEAKKWINEEFQPSALSTAEQEAEMEWFINAAKPFVNRACTGPPGGADAATPATNSRPP